MANTKQKIIASLVILSIGGFAAYKIAKKKLGEKGVNAG
jgi:hypothetical protein